MQTDVTENDLTECSNCGREERKEGEAEREFEIEVCWSVRFGAAFCRRCYTARVERAG